VIVLLELIEVLERKGRHIWQKLIKVDFNNRKVYRKIVQDIRKLYKFS